MRISHILAAIAFAIACGLAAAQQAVTQPQKESPMLSIGFASVDITPGPQLGLKGYEFRQDRLAAGNAGVHDPLNARVMVIDDGSGKVAALVSLDLCVLPTPVSRDFRAALAEKLATDPGRVIIACSHTHSGPMPTNREVALGWRMLTEEQSDDVVPEIAYTASLKDKLLDAAARAEGLKYPVDAFVREAPLGIAYNRRVSDGSGGVKHCWGPQEWPDRQPGQSPDPTCTLLMLRRSVGQQTYLLWSLGAHPVVLGKTSRVVSADYPGRACKLIEEYVPQSKAMFFLGACGNTHPWIATQEDPAMIEPVARAAASFVALLSQAGKPMSREFAAAASTVTIGRHEVDLAVWRLGQAYIVACPVELFTELSADLRKRLDAPVLMCTVANGWAGYWPTREAFAEGGYEVNGASRKLSPGDGEKLIDELEKLAKSLAGSN